MDLHLDVVIPPLVKKAADTNIFIGEEAEKTLVSAFFTCNEIRLFNSIIGLGNVRSNTLKSKVSLCNMLVERLGEKIV